MIPLTREIDDFSRGFHDALGRIGSEDEHDNGPSRTRAGVSERHGVGRPTAAGREPYADDAADAQPYNNMRPLWQQQRRQSRNLMWM